MAASHLAGTAWLRVIGTAVALLVGLLLLQAASPRLTHHADAALIGRVVVLDPGHGGDEPGAIGGGIIERDSNLEMAFRVKALLEAQGVRVVMTRQSVGRAPGIADTAILYGYSAMFADLQARIATANLVHADAFVSIHSNALTDPSVRGLEAWYDVHRSFSARNRQLAVFCMDSVSRALAAAGYSVPTRGAVDEAQLVGASGSTTPLLVLGPERDISRAELIANGGDPAAIGLLPTDTAFHTVATQMPGALLELLYVSNDVDAGLLRDELARAAMARGVAAGIIRFLEQPATKFVTTPIFGTGGQALVVFNGGSADDLEVSALAAGATGVWVQDAGGVYRLLVVGGPSFMKSAFLGSFPRGFTVATAVTLV